MVKPAYDKTHYVNDKFKPIYINNNKVKFIALIYREIF